MKKYRGGELAPRGVYLNLATWEVEQLHGEVRILPGGSGGRYVKVPAPLAIVAGPFAGLAFIIFLPLAGIVGVASLLAYKIGLKTWALGQRVVQPLAIRWRPGEAYLTRQGHAPEEAPPAEEAEEGLAELEQEVARQRQQGEE